MTDPDPYTSRRLAKVWVTPELLLGRMETGGLSAFVECVDGLPPGAVWIGSHEDRTRHLVGLVFYHPTFAEICVGEELPIVRVLYHNRMTPEALRLRLEDIGKLAPVPTRQEIQALIDDLFPPKKRPPAADPFADADSTPTDPPSVRWDAPKIVEFVRPAPGSKPLELTIVKGRLDGCRHLRVEVDPVLASVRCLECDALLDPVGTLARFAEEETRLEWRAEKAREAAAELAARSRTVCTHCGRTTKISGS